MKATLFVIFLMALLYIITGCAQAGNDKHSEQDYNVIIGIDGTTSYTSLTSAQKQLEEVISELPQGAMITIRFITEDSFTDSSKNEILVKELPDCSAVLENPFDTVGKMNALRAKQDLDAVRSEVINIIKNIQSPAAGKTDIYGFLENARQRFEEDNATKKIIILLSDLDNNVKIHEPDLSENALSGIDVLVLNYQRNDPANYENWKQTFTKLGAKTVRFVSSGGKVNLPQL